MRRDRLRCWAISRRVKHTLDPVGAEISAEQTVSLGALTIQRVEITLPGTRSAADEKLSVYVESSTKLIVRTEGSLGTAAKPEPVHLCDGRSAQLYGPQTAWNLSRTTLLPTTRMRLLSIG